MFLRSAADIAIFGGAAGGGKTYALLLCWLYYFDNPHFGSVTFRRNATQVRNEGGLWDESVKIYTPLGATPRQVNLDWKMPSGMRVKFAHLEHEKSVFDWQGAQIAGIAFDELTHFTQSQFFYMLSRNRSVSGVKPHVRATCNPDADSWVRGFIDWWIGEDGFPIPERAGKLRWFCRIDDTLHWADSKEEIIARHGPERQPKSVTFIPSKITDNQILMRANPEYMANLLSLSRVDRERLLDGNWNVRLAGGSIFQKDWFEIVDVIRSGWIDCIRFWDRAATKPIEGKTDPDWTRGIKVYRYADGTFIVADLRSLRDTPGQVERMIKNTASFDTIGCRVMSQQDPGSAGVSEAEHFKKMLLGYDVRTAVYSKDKITRAKPVSAQCEAGNIKLLRAPWNEEFLSELEAFPDGTHDDCVDVLSGAFNELAGKNSIIDFY